MTESTVIYKILPRHEWEQASGVGQFLGSGIDIQDGFIHFSTASQVPGTLQKHFPGQTDLVLVSVNSAVVAANLRWETSRGGELFPHVYAPLPTSAALTITPLPLASDGTHVLPANWPDLPANWPNVASRSPH